MELHSVPLTIQNSTGDEFAQLIIYERIPGTLFEVDETVAESHGEAPIQLVEGRTYEFQLMVADGGSVRIRESSVIQPSRVNKNMGRIEPGLQTGALPITLEDETGLTIGQAILEVRSDKLNYQSDYRDMLASIADHCIDLLLDIQAPAQVTLSPSDSETTPSLHQRVAFIRHLLTSNDFNDALDRILALPHQQMRSEPTVVPTHRGIRRGGTLAAALSRGSQRLSVPVAHPTYALLNEGGTVVPTLPKHVRGFRRYESLDTPENRFVVFVLSVFRQTVDDVISVIQGRTEIESKRLTSELLPLLSLLNEYLSSPFARSVGRATTLPLGSPVLQRKHGYREVLRTWLQFNLAANLTWSGGDDVYSAGKKDVATLYEYWCYFLLLDALKRVVSFPTPPAESLIDMTQSGLHLRLKAGRSFDLVGHYEGSGTLWCVRYSYNRTYSGVPPSFNGSYPRPGSWTRTMRPDFSISLWPASLSEYEAEIAERIAHVHFDAKYRVDSYLGLFGTSDNIGVSDSDEYQVGGRAKRSDLLKMHAYRDAIRRSAGAYVLYPGPESGDIGWIEYHEILPGLGAFAARPGRESRVVDTLAEFLSDVVKHIDHISNPLRPPTIDCTETAPGLS